MREMFLIEDDGDDDEEDTLIPSWFPTPIS